MITPIFLIEYYKNQEAIVYIHDRENCFELADAIDGTPCYAVTQVILRYHSNKAEIQLLITEEPVINLEQVIFNFYKGKNNDKGRI